MRLKQMRDTQLMKKMTVKEKRNFLANVLVDFETGCWEWNKHFNDGGYGIHRFRGVTKKTHRLSYEMTHGATEMLLRHSCDNRKCCNPEHLTPGTHKENMKDHVLRGEFKRRQANATTKYRGVSKRKNRYEARINKDGKTVALGHFLSAEGAAIAWNKAAKEIWGEEAPQNLIPKTYNKNRS